jgi:hypothetical protein
MRNFSRFLAAAAGLACAASMAFALDQTIKGKTLSVKGGDPSKRKVTASGKEKASPNFIVGNPTLAGTAGGAFLTIFVNGATSSSGAFTLPSGNSSTGKPFWSVIGNDLGFRYKDPKGDNGPVKSAQIKRSPNGSFSIKAKLNGKNGVISVVPPGADVDNFGCVALKIGIGNASMGDRYSLQWGPGSKFINGNNKFKATKPPGEGVCPIVTTTSTTSSTTSSSLAPTTSTTGPTLPVTTTTTTSSTTTTSLYGSPSRAFLSQPVDLLD